MPPNPNHPLADAIRRALIDAAEAAYEDAGIQGLCAEGRWEAAVSAMRGVDIETVVQGRAGASTESSPSTESSSATSAESSPSTAIPER